MKYSLVAIAVFGLAACATHSAQTGAGTQAATAPELRRGCDALEFDVVLGHLNGLIPTATQDRIQGVFPCATGATDDTTNYAGVYFKKHDFYFYTTRDFVEIRKGFVGKDVRGLIGDYPEKVNKVLGTPTTSEKLPLVAFHPTSYGCARVEYERDSVTKLAAHYQPCSKVIEWLEDAR